MAAWLDIFFRSILLLIISWIFIKLSKRRKLSEITPFQFISYLVIGVIAALTSLGIIRSIIFAIISLGVWITFPILLEYISIKSKFIYNLFYGKETVIISHGKILEKNLGKVRINRDDLLKSLRSKNIFNLNDVEFALVENTGEINVLLKSDKQPVVPKDFGIKISPGTEPQTVILDGEIINESLTKIGLNQEWLKTELKKMGVSLDNVFIGQVDTFGELYLDLFNDTVSLSQPKVREMLFANLKKCQSDLMSFGLETNNNKAKDMFFMNSYKLKGIIEKLEPYLLH